MDVKQNARGWHAAGAQPPRKGIGSATVEPFRDRSQVLAIKGSLASKPRDFALFVVGIHVGLRGSDLLALRWNHVSTPDGTILRRIGVTEAKTGKYRRLVLQEPARNALKSWRTQCPDSAPEALVFPNPRGGSLSIQRLHQLVNQWARGAGVEGHFGTHSLRKTYGCHLRQTGAGIEILMKVFGHSSPAITLRYIGLEAQEIDEANLKLNL